MFSKVADPIFNKAPEWVSMGEMSSLHVSPMSIEIPELYVIMSYPRAFTPVCNQELKNLRDAINNGKIRTSVFVASSDSPEAQQQFYQDEEYFEDGFFYHPSITLRYSYLTKKGQSLLLDEDGYSFRTTIAVNGDKIVYVHREFNDEVRDINELIRVCNKLSDYDGAS